MKRFIPLMLFLTLLLPLASCRNEARAQIENELESARAENEEKIQAVEELSERNENPADGEETEENSGAGQGAANPEKQSSAADWDGILSSEYQLVGNKYYYECGAVKNGETVRTLMYYDLLTRESGVICPDPLCRHDDPAVCKYISTNSKTCFVFENTHTLYWVRFINGQSSIWQYDLANDSAKKIISTARTEPQLVGAENGVLYYSDSKTDLQNGRVVYRDYIFGVDTATGNTVYERAMDAGMNPLFIRNGIVWMDLIKSIALLDIAHDELNSICEYPGGLRTWYYDTHDGSFWFNAIDPDHMSGSVWMWKDDTVSQIDLPADEIYYFQLTNTRVYYSPYDPLKLGDGPIPNMEVYDYCGGKVYETDRVHPNLDASLVYDAGGQYVICMSGAFGYCIFGDKLCFSLYSILREQRNGREVVGLNGSVDNPMMCIDLTSRVEEIITFD
ncbi:MAG: hypothetical protein II889_08455 [Clostridia bacterium]|nr:hypothetical protein [Clostridia bacterium]